MNLKLQAENINRLLTKIYSTPTRISDLLLSQGLTLEQLAVIRQKYLEKIFTQFVDLIEEMATTKSTGSKRRSYIVIRRFGLAGDLPETLESTGKTMGISRERVRQLEKKVLTKLRHPKNRRILEERLKNAVSNLFED